MVLSASLASGAALARVSVPRARRHRASGRWRGRSRRSCWPRGPSDPDAVRTRVMHGAHPDLTWVRPSGAHVMRVDDVEGPVVNAAYRTPFEARRRVFVLERVDTMNDEVANRLLKTLEEPASLRAPDPDDGPAGAGARDGHLALPAGALRAAAGGDDRCRSWRPRACPRSRRRRARRLSLGNAARARYLASPEGEQLRSDVEALRARGLGGRLRRGPEPWRPLLVRAESAGPGRRGGGGGRGQAPTGARAKGPRAQGDREGVRRVGEAGRATSSHASHSSSRSR